MARPGMQATCPLCGGRVLPKCGRIKIWHWAHVASECDPWSEGITEWHLEWQRRFPEQWREISVVHSCESHRADIRVPNGIVVEFQHSSISPEEIAEREKFYGLLMRWVFDARDAYSSGRLSFSLRWTPERKPYVALRWKHPRKTLGHARRPVFLDIGEGLLINVVKFDLRSPAAGWGHLTNHGDFAKKIRDTPHA